MKSKSFYVFGLIILYSLLMTFYSFSAGYFEKQNNQFVKFAKNHKSKTLESSKRMIASIEPVAVEQPDLTDLSEFYFSRHRELMKSGKTNQAIKMLSRVQNFSSDAELQMRSSYYQAEYFCKKGDEKECLKQIDHMVSLSPESPWSGRALVLLAQYYSVHNKLPELVLLKDVISEQFKKLSLIHILRTLDRASIFLSFQ